MVWEIRRADNLDKHNLIVPTVTVAQLRGMSFRDVKNNNVFSDITAKVTAGDTLSLISYQNDARLEITNQGQAACGITFPQSAEVFAGQPVFPTLLQCIQGVNSVLNIIKTANIEAFIRTKVSHNPAPLKPRRRS